MSHYMYGSKARCNDSSYSRVLRLVEDDGRVSYVRFCYEWEAAEWKEKYMSVKNEYARLTHVYQNWDLTKKEYTRELKICDWKLRQTLLKKFVTENVI